MLRLTSAHRRGVVGPQWGALIALLLCCPSIASAQQQEKVPPPDTVRVPPPVDGEPGFVTKARHRLDRLHEHGWYPEVGTIVSASGLAFGGQYRSPAHAATGISAEAGLMWSLRNYREYVGRIGRLSHMRDTIRLEPAGEEITSTTNVRSTKVVGTALYVEGRRFNYRRVDYFGIDPTVKGERADYAVVGTAMDLVGQWQARPDLGVSGRWGVLELRPGRGTNSSLPGVEEVYSEPMAPGLTAVPRYSVAGAAAAWDTRDSAKISTDGLFAAGAVWRYNALNERAPTFTRFAADVRAFQALTQNGQHVVAANLVAAADRTPGAQPIPFYLQSWLGGSHSLRNFSNYRLRGESLVNLSIEHRWHVQRFIEIAPFFDIGAVSSTGRSLSDGPLYKAGGIGIRVRNDTRVFVRLDYAHGDEGGRLLFALSPSF
jgi:hypothetical protein